MSCPPRVASSPRNLLHQNLGGSFTTRARGLLATKAALLDPEGEEFGRPRLTGVFWDAELRTGNRVAAVEASGKLYRMVANGEGILAAGPKGRSIYELEISCGDRTCEVRVGFFATSRLLSTPAAKGWRPSPGLGGWRYGALFAPEDGRALRIMVFLLWHLVANRRCVYLEESPTSESTDPAKGVLENIVA